MDITTNGSRLWIPLHTLPVLLGMAVDPQKKASSQVFSLGLAFVLSASVSLLQRMGAALVLEAGELEGQCSDKCSY